MREESFKKRETRKLLRHELADSQGFIADGGAILSIVYS